MGRMAPIGPAMVLPLRICILWAMRVSVRLVLVFAVCLLGGLTAESLMLLRGQTGRFAQELRDDFRVLVFLQGDVDASKRAVLRGLPGAGA